ncbi:MAG TPA: hypothetical protein IAD02_03465 [Candidatus Enterousia intestinigallinarum]|uniref:DUF3429 domain-containing protein n=1 Tax=Candidatus Enterousia intestinigallinarum TaxID=2840790 RepID=A0A9D1FG62_9PROT|nr:hypothetical protein [Candidatus Enterousia intestinigallinarum]
MKKVISQLGFAALAMLMVMPAAMAVCPVCTVAVGAGLEGMRLLGVDDVITGIWAGGLTLSLFFWTAGWLKKHNVKSAFWQIVVPFVFYYGLLGLVYALPSVEFGAATLWGIDKFLLGIIVGTIAFYLGARWYIKIKRENGGHAKFAFQKVVVPLSFLIVATIVFWLITM